MQEEDGGIFPFIVVLVLVTTFSLSLSLLFSFFFLPPPKKKKPWGRILVRNAYKRRFFTSKPKVSLLSSSE